MPDPIVSTTTSDDLTPARPARRAVLRTAGLVALAGGGVAALGACSGDGEPIPSPAASAPSSPVPSAEPTSAPSPDASSAASGPSVSAAEVPVGGGYILPDADYVVTQPEKGTYKAFSKLCTHQGCPVAQIVAKEIVCNCHGSHFSISDGSVLSGPAKKPLPEAKATVSGDQIVVSA